MSGLTYSFLTKSLTRLKRLAASVVIDPPGPQPSPGDFSATDFSSSDFDTPT